MIYHSNLDNDHYMFSINGGQYWAESKPCNGGYNFWTYRCPYEHPSELVNIITERGFRTAKQPNINPDAPHALRVKLVNRYRFKAVNDAHAAVNIIVNTLNSAIASFIGNSEAVCIVKDTHTRYRVHLYAQNDKQIQYTESKIDNQSDFVYLSASIDVQGQNHVQAVNNLLGDGWREAKTRPIDETNSALSRMVKRIELTLNQALA